MNMYSLPFRLMMSSSTTLGAVTSTVTSIINASTSTHTSSEVVSTTTTGPAILPTTPTHAPIFLETKAAQGIAGAFVWVALFLTCQQVCEIFISA